MISVDGSVARSAIRSSAAIPGQLAEARRVRYAAERRQRKPKTVPGRAWCLLLQTSPPVTATGRPGRVLAGRTPGLRQRRLGRRSASIPQRVRNAAHQSGDLHPGTAPDPPAPRQRCSRRAAASDPRCPSTADVRRRRATMPVPSCGHSAQPRFDVKPRTAQAREATAAAGRDTGAGRPSAAVSEESSGIMPNAFPRRIRRCPARPGTGPFTWRRDTVLGGGGSPGQDDAISGLRVLDRNHRGPVGGPERCRQNGRHGLGPCG